MGWAWALNDATAGLVVGQASEMMFSIISPSFVWFTIFPPSTFGTAYCLEGVEVFLFRFFSRFLLLYVFLSFVLCVSRFTQLKIRLVPQRID